MYNNLHAVFDIKCFYDKEFRQKAKIIKSQNSTSSLTTTKLISPISGT